MKVLLAGGQSRSVPTHVTWGLWVEFSLSTAPRPVSQALLETVAGLGRGESGGCCNPESLVQTAWMTVCPVQLCPLQREFPAPPNTPPQTQSSLTVH